MTVCVLKSRITEKNIGLIVSVIMHVRKIIRLIGRNINEKVTHERICFLNVESQQYNPALKYIILSPKYFFISKHRETIPIFRFFYLSLKENFVLKNI